MMKKEEYSPFKLVHHSNQIDALKYNHQIVPIHVQLVPTNRCNQNCILCAYRMPGYPSNQLFDPHDEIPFLKVQEILKDCRNMNVQAIQITGGGEPLMHPKANAILRWILYSGMKLALVTNGVLMDDETIDLVKNSSWVRISMEASKPETYAKYRRTTPDAYHVVINNLKKICQGERKTTVGVGFVVNEWNYREIYHAATIAKDLGVDNFRISGAFTTQGSKYFEGFEEHAKSHAFRAVEDLNDNDFTVFNLIEDRIFDVGVRKQDYHRCIQKDVCTYIAADQVVYTCCMQAYNVLGRIGSVDGSTFEKVWMGEEKRKFFNRHDPTKNCPHPCMYREKNFFANYLVGRGKHREFV